MWVWYQFKSIFLFKGICLGSENFYSRVITPHEEGNRNFANGVSTGVCWQRYGVISPIDEIPGSLLAKVLFGEIPKPHEDSTILKYLFRYFSENISYI
jgi:hypothetical protein